MNVMKFFIQMDDENDFRKSYLFKMLYLKYILSNEHLGNHLHTERLRFYQDIRFCMQETLKSASEIESNYHLV